MTRAVGPRGYGLPADVVGFAGLAAVLLVILLPVLVAGASIDRPATESERALVSSIGEQPTEGLPGPFRSFVELWLDPVDDLSKVEGAVTRSRFGALGLLLVTSILTFASTAQALSRGFAALACLALALSPAIQVEGATLRPEALALLFAQLGCAVLVSLPAQQRASRQRGPLGAVLTAISAGACYALCVASVPRQAVSFGVPVTCALFAVLRASRGFLRTATRTRFRVLPFRSFRRRTGPLALAAVTTLVAALGFLRGEPPISRGAGLFPSYFALEFLGRALLFVGLLGWLPGLLRQWLRSSYFSAAHILFVHSAILAATSWSLQDGDDHSLAAPGVGMFSAYGVGVLIYLIGRTTIGRPGESIAADSD
ncbi:MAG: hypothetical protein AAF196_14645 [Planctomycetota bacterium]